MSDEIERKIMRVLVACEESGTVTDAFVERGHDAHSCDLLPSRGRHTGRHFQENIFSLLLRIGHEIEPFDMLIAHWDCTYITNTAVSLLTEVPGQRNRKPETLIGPARWRAMEKACHSFNLLLRYGSQIGKFCLENPIPHGHATKLIGSYTQIVHPWQFGHGEQKSTCLWLGGVPKLVPTNIVDGREQNIWKMSPGMKNGLTRKQRRSVTYQGIADAMASQWG